MTKEISKEGLAAMADKSPLKPPLSFRPTTRIRSTNFAIRGGKMLTDRKIRKYALEGRYGEDARQRELARCPVKKATAHKSAMDVLKELRKMLGL